MVSGILDQKQRQALSSGSSLFGVGTPFSLFWQCSNPETWSIQRKDLNLFIEFLRLFAEACRFFLFVVFRLCKMLCFVTVD